MTARRVAEPVEVSNEDLQDELDDLKLRLNKQEAKIDLMLIRTDELIFAYNTAKGITSFIKWAAGLVAAGLVLWTSLFGGKLPHP